MQLFDIHRRTLDPLDVVVGTVLLGGLLLVGWLATGTVVGTAYDFVTPLVADGTIQSDLFDAQTLVAVVYGLLGALVLVPTVLCGYVYAAARLAARRPRDRLEPWD